MSQPNELDVGNEIDLANHRLLIAEEDLESAEVLMNCGRFRGANNRAIRQIEERIKPRDDSIIAWLYFFLLYRKDRLQRSLELKKARTEAGTTSRR